MNILLYPLAFLYYLIVVARNALFDWRWFAPTKVKALVIGVGNVSAGGTGKTPITAYLCRQLESKGYRVAIVSRGYGGKYSESATRVDINKNNAPQYYGDEPVMLASQLNMPVFVGSSRVTASELAIRESQADCIVADDAFQHRWLHRDINCVVFDATETQMQLLPVGRLREPLSALERAHVVFVTRASFVSIQERQNKIDILKSYGFSAEKQNLFFVEFKLSNIIHVHTYARMTGNECFLLSAIGKPKNFEAAMKAKYSVLQHFKFADHYSWSQKEWDSILETCKASGGAPIVVTEKDAVKIRNLKSNDYPVFFAQMDLVMDKDFSIEHVFARAGVGQ